MNIGLEMLRRFDFKFSPTSLFASLLLLVVLLTISIDAYLIQRTYLYFGGGALNRPFALTEFVEYLEYFLYASFFDFFLIAIVLYFSIRLVNRFLSLTPLQIYYGVASFFLIIYALFTAVSMGVASYFAGHFDINILIELTGGDLTNVFSFISLKQWLLLLGVFSIIVFNFLLVRLIARVNFLSEIFNSVVRLPLTIPIAAIFLLISNVFIDAKAVNLEHGLSSKFSYATLTGILNKLSDFDMDGFGPLTNPADTDNFNSDINPYAVEILNNGLDENGIAGDLKNASLELVSHSKLKGTKVVPGKNVIVVVVETFRTDLIGNQIGSEQIMPFLSSLSLEHAHTPHVYSNYGVTSRAIQTIFMGSLNFNQSTNSMFDYFKLHGYKTIGVSAQAESWGDTDKVLNFGSFDLFYDSRDKDRSNSSVNDFHKMKGDLATIDSAELNQKIFEYLEKTSNSPFIMYINYQDLHYPYHAESWDKKFISQGNIRAEFFTKENRENIFAQYANAAHHLDRSIKELVDKLRSLDLFDDTVIIFTGDHPDSFFENGVLGHAWTLDKHQRETPLVIINGNGKYTVPLGQDEIVPIVINSASSENTGSKAKFSLEEEKKIFVLSGSLNRPRQIGLLGVKGLEQYDFKTNIINIFEKEIVLSEADQSLEEFPNIKALFNKWESEVYIKYNLR